MSTVEPTIARRRTQGDWSLGVSNRCVYKHTYIYIFEIYLGAVLRPMTAQKNPPPNKTIKIVCSKTLPRLQCRKQKRPAGSSAYYFYGEPNFLISFVLRFWVEL